MKKIIMVVPHLSTGGLPQYTYNMIQHISEDYEIWCVEWDDITGGVLVVQKNRIESILNGKYSDNRLITLGEDKYEFLRIIDTIEPDVIHFQEIPETFIPTDILDAIWFEDRVYDIITTTHSSYTDPTKIKYVADQYVLVSEWSKKIFVKEFDDNFCSVWEYKVESNIFDKEIAKLKLGFDPKLTHILHVGLFTPGKNQKAIIEAARISQDPTLLFHFVGNQADNFKDYWEPIMSDLPNNCIWHGERDDVDMFYRAADIFVFPSLFELNPLALIEAKGYGLPLIIRNLETYEGKYDDDAIYINDNPIEILEGINKIKDYPKLNVYQTERNGKIRRLDPNINISFVDGPKITITDAPGDVFDVTFKDMSTGIIYYQVEVGNGCWAKANITWAVDWSITTIRRSDGKVFEERFNPLGKRVFITLDSKSLGDTLAWFPQVEEFRKKWNCHVICSTFMNDELKNQYTEIEFVNPGSVVNNIYAMFNIGWFWDGDLPSRQKHPNDFRKFPLGKTAADILGLEYKQTKTLLEIPNIEKIRRVGFGIHSTAQTKYWNNPTGWQELTNFFNAIGYEVIVLSNEGDGYMGNKYPEGVSVLIPGDLNNLKMEMSKCELFIGIGSGLSWLAWTLNIPTVLISGFSEPISEFDGDGVLRIFNPNSCNGCYNRYKFNPGDWNWCPDHSGTERQFECTKSITGSHVLSKILEKGWIKLIY